MGEGYDVGLTGEQWHCVAVVAVQGEMVGPDTLAHVEDDDQIVRCITVGKRLRAGRKLLEHVELPGVICDVFVDQLVGHYKIYQRPALRLVGSIIEVEGFRAAGDGRNTQKKGNAVKAPDAGKGGPCGRLVKGTAAPVNGQVDKAGQQQRSRYGPDRAEGAGFLEIGLCDAGQDGEAQGHSVPHLHHVQARIEQDDGRKNGVSREAVFQAKQDDAAEQAGGADNPHAAHQHALTVIEYIWIDHQRRYEAGRPQAAHAAGYERGTQSLQNRRPYVLFCKVPCRRVGSCPG